MTKENVIPMNIEAGDLPEHPLVDFGRAFVRTAGDHLLGISEVKSMDSLYGVEHHRRIAFEEAVSEVLEMLDNPTPDELRGRWSRMNMHEGGIEWDGPLPNWTPGLKVTEEDGGMGEG